VSLAQALAEFQASATQCDSLIANAHQLDADGKSILPELDQRQITVAAFLNLFVAWETFLEEVLAQLMAGEPTISGRAPTRYVSPPTEEAARLLVVGVQRYFDYGNQENIRKVVRMYFEGGYPFEPHLSAIVADLADLRTMRNASAHLTSTTRAALEGLAQRIFSTPRIGIDLYSLLMLRDPRSETDNTVFAECRQKLLVVAEIIAKG
jgi:hypothetical protein